MGKGHVLKGCLPWAVALMCFPAAGVAAVGQEAARREVQTYCSPCHARDGQGQGALANQLKSPPPDLTKLSKRAGGTFPAKQVRLKIEGLEMPAAHGTSEMPVWSSWFVQDELKGSTELSDAGKAARETDARIARLVEYLESIQD